MFGKKPQREARASLGSDGTTLIAAGTEIHGNVRFRGVMHVEGKVVGDVQAYEGTLRLIDGGSLEGDIHAPHIVINGEVKGDVHASEKLELANNAKINGNVYYKLIEMVIGAQVNGSLERVDTVEQEPKLIAQDTSPEWQQEAKEAVLVD